MKIKQILEGLTDEQVDQFHTELDDLVHKHLGHSSDEEEHVEESEALTYKDLQNAFDQVYDYVGTMGDSALEYLYRYAPTFDNAMDSYGDIEAIAKNASQEELQTYIDELEATRYELELTTHESVEEAVAGPDKCWPGYAPGAQSGVKTKPGTGKNAGKRVNNCEPTKAKKK